MGVLLWLVVVGGLLAVAVVGWINLRRHGESTVPAAGWQRTAETFRDPSTDRLMRVWVDPADGSRHYVPE